MASEKTPQTNIRSTISGPVTGQAAVGSHLNQVQTSIAGSRVTDADRAAIKQLFDDLCSRVEAGAPPDKKLSALERVNELEQAITAAIPDLTTMEIVKQWFVKQLPGLAGSVTGLVAHPLVGKIVGAAGESLAAEFRRRFGTTEHPDQPYRT